MSSEEEKAILDLWISNERKGFGEIRKGLSEKLDHHYDPTQINRYLKRLVEKGLLNKNFDEKSKPYYVPSNAPVFREYVLSNYYNKIRQFSLDKGWFIETEPGAQWGFGVVRTGFYGIPEPDYMTDLEGSILGYTAYKIKKLFQGYHKLCQHIAYRRKNRLSRMPLRDYEMILYDYIFDLMFEQGKQQIMLFDDIGLDALCSMVPDFLDFMSEMHEKYGWVKGRNEVKDDALELARKLLDIPDDFDELTDAEPPIFEIENYDFDLCAILATHSPRTLEEYASHPENVIMKWWTQFDGQEIPAKDVMKIIELEGKGINIYDLQDKNGVERGRRILGLEELAESFTCLSNPKGLRKLKIKLTDDVIKRLGNWDWLLERIGKRGFDRFIRIVKMHDKIAEEGYNKNLNHR